MTDAWPTVPLGDVLTQRREFILIDDAAQYKRCRVQLHAKGVELRDIVSGAEVKTKKQQVCKTGEFLVAEIDAKVGGFGLVPDHLEGAIVSSHYFLFGVHADRLDRRFLDYYVRTKDFRDQVTAQGSTNYAAIRPADVLGYTMPLPSLPEQRRIVARIEELAGKIEEARGLRREAVEECELLCRSLISSDAFLTSTPMRELVQQKKLDVTVSPQNLYHFAGVYCFGRGVFSGVQKIGQEFKYDRLTRLRAGDFIYPKLMAWEGAFGVVPPNCDGLVVSPEFPVFTVDENHVLPEVLDVYFRDPAVWTQISGVSTGTNVRRRRLNPADFLRYELPLPSMKTQMTLRAVKKRLEALKPLQAETAAELEALLPSVLDRAFSGRL